MEQATLTIQRKMQNGSRYSIYRELFKSHKDGGSFEEVVRKMDEEPDTFGKVRFVEGQGGVHYEHLPLGERLSHHQLQTQMDIPAEWLFCFSFQEMNVIGLDMGVFEAYTTVEKALSRLEWMDIPSGHELYTKRRDLYVWLKDNARLEDRIRLCSEWIYYHPEGKYDYFFVRQDINRRIALLKSQLTCEHWTKKVS
jgi:hypothetical protein